MSGFLEGKVAVVTGGSRGIGRASALQLARDGAAVIVSSRKLDACQAVVDEIVASGGRALAVACHIGRKDDCEALIERTLAEFGRLDVLVLNAAINVAYAPVAEVTEEAAHKTVQANVFGNLTLCQKAYPAMKAAGGGSIVLVSSMGSRSGAPGVSIYCMTKAAGEQLVRSLAVEWGQDGIRVNGVAPGLIRTDLAALFLANEKLVKKIEQGSPLRRIGEPQDIAGVVRFLCSPDAAYVTGQTIPVDGGNSVVGA